VSIFGLISAAYPESEEHRPFTRSVVPGYHKELRLVEKNEISYAAVSATLSKMNFAFLLDEPSAIG